MNHSLFGQLKSYSKELEDFYKFADDHEASEDTLTLKPLFGTKLQTGSAPVYRNLTHPSLTPAEPEADEEHDGRMAKFRKSTVADKELMTCDDILCMYLRDVCKRVCPEYYKNVLRFVFLYRECLNEYGWIKRYETFSKAGMKQSEDPVVSKFRAQDPEEQERMQESEKDEEEKCLEDIYIPQQEYTAVCNGDFLPMVCNEFVTEFFDKEHGACALDRGDAIDLTRNLN